MRYIRNGKHKKRMLYEKNLNDRISSLHRSYVIGLREIIEASANAAGTVAQTETSKETSPAASTQAPGSTAEFKILTGKVTEVSDNMDP